MMRGALTAAATVTVLVAAGWMPPRLAARANQSKSHGPLTQSHQTIRRIPNPTADLRAQAQAALKEKDYSSAVDLLTRYLNDSPDDAIGHFQLGYAYTALQRWNDAEAEYRKAVGLNPKLAPAQLNLGLVLLRDDPTAAVGPLQQAVTLEPDQAQPHMLLAAALERSGKPADAVPQYREAAKLDDKNFDTHFELARLLLSLHQAAEAEPEFRRALAIQPNSPDALAGLVDALLQQKKNDEGMGELTKYLQQKPGDEAARMQLANLLIGAGRLDDALAQLALIHSPGPNALAADRQRAQILLHQNKDAEAIAPLRAALALAPNDAEMHADLGHVLAKQKKFPAAAQELARAVQLNPQLPPSTWSELAETLYLTGQWQATLDALNHVEQSEPLTPLAWFVRASCYDHLGRLAPAIDAYKKFLGIDGGRLATDEYEAKHRLPVLQDLLRHQGRK